MMTVLILVFGVFLILAGTSLIVRPQIVYGFLADNLDQIWLYPGAIVTRLVLGAMLIYFASISKYPPIINVIGWIFVGAACVLAAIGRKRFKRLLSWVLTVFEPYNRAGGIGSVCLGVFLIYALL